MYLIIKGRSPQFICRSCKALHRPKDCPAFDGRVLEQFQRGSDWTWRELMNATGLQYFQVLAAVNRLTAAGYLNLPSSLYKSTSDKNVIELVTKMSSPRGSAA